MFPDTPKTLLKKIAELAHGDDCAEWEAFVELYEPPLRRFVRLQSPMLSEADVEDVVQDVFVRLVTVLREEKIDRAKGTFRAYLASMTRRILIDRYRAAQVRPQLLETVQLSDIPVCSTDRRLSAGTDPDNFPVTVPHASFGTPVSADASTHSSFSIPHSSFGTLDPGVAVDILWRMAAHEAAKEHVFTKTAISEQSKRIYELLERGLSLHDTAAQTGISYDSVKQVKSRIDRAIAAVERCISGA